jgi:hypothetical protein
MFNLSTKKNLLGVELRSDHGSWPSRGTLYSTGRGTHNLFATPGEKKTIIHKNQHPKHIGELDLKLVTHTD